MPIQHKLFRSMNVIHTSFAFIYNLNQLRNLDSAGPGQKILVGPHFLAEIFGFRLSFTIVYNIKIIM